MNKDFLTRLLAILFFVLSGAGITIAQVPPNCVKAIIQTNPVNKTICVNGNGSFSVVANGSVASYHWQESTDGGNSWANITNGGVYSNSNDATLNLTAVTLSLNGYQYRCFVTDSCLTDTVSNAAVLTVSQTPAVPGAINGSTSVCTGVTTSYSVIPVAGATSYVWTLPSGWTGTSLTSSIGPSPSANSGNVTVKAKNTCGTSGAQTLGVTVTSKPVLSGSINGPTVICANTTNTYSITPPFNATSYSWTIPGGWSGTSVTNSISPVSTINSGNILVKAENFCGSSSQLVISVSVYDVPSMPGSISGSNAVCSAIAKTYTCPSVSGATSYTWTLPNGWTGTSTTNSISTVPSSQGGTISVTANNSCGSSAPQTLIVTVDTPPSTPGTITGQNTTCSGSSGSYSVDAVPGATSYTWTLPSGWTGSSATTSISTTASVNGGVVTVTANSSCGSSSAQTLTVTVNTTPATPGAITGPGNTCAGITNNYSVSAVAGATSYTWTLPNGWTGTSVTNEIDAVSSSGSGSVSVTANNGCGSSAQQTLPVNISGVPAVPSTISGPATMCEGASNTFSVNAVSGADSYTWVLPGGWAGTSVTNSISATASATGGTISVTADNACGSSPAQTLPVTINMKPATPSAITGEANICAGTSNSYLVNTVSGATSYTWGLPGGWTGTSSTGIINTTASANNGDITVIANNSCGSSSAQTFTVTVNTTPSSPIVINGETGTCAGSSNTYSVEVVNGASSFTWVLPNGWLGTSSINTINTTASAAGGIIMVTADNSCGSSAPQSLVVTVNDIPGTPGSISGPAAVCKGTANTYSVSTVSGATYYTWTLPAGWSGNFPVNSIMPTASQNSGDITITVNNSCGSSPTQTLHVTVNALPVPGIISAVKDSICEGAVAFLTVTGSSANDFQWQLSDTTFGFTDINAATSTSYISGAVTHDTYFRIVASNGNCLDTSSAKKITALPAPVADFTFNATGRTVDFNSDGSTGAVDFVWDFGDTTSSAIPNPSHTYFKAGVYHACLTVKNSTTCNYTFCQNVIISSTGIDVIEEGEIFVYPNPFDSYIIADVKNTTGYTLIINDIAGREMIRLNNLTGKNIIDIPAGMVDGVYVISLNSKEGDVMVKRLLKASAR